MDNTLFVYLSFMVIGGLVGWGVGLFWARHITLPWWQAKPVTPWLPLERFEEFCPRPEVEEPPPWSVERLRRAMEQ